MRRRGARRREPLRYLLRAARPPLRDLLAFGGGQTAAQLANYFANQGDYIVVGRYLDAATLGIYTRAYELMRFPSTVFTNIAGKVLFSSFARLQDDSERLAQSFRRVLFANAIILLPASAGESRHASLRSPGTRVGCAPCIGR